MILVLGKNSQIAKYLAEERSIKFSFIGSDKLDLTNLKNIRHILSGYNPKLIINLMSFNDVDKAEYDKNAFLINHEAVSIICDYCLSKKIPLFHFSTNDVFSSNKLPIYENGQCKPINQYGISKYNGEKVIKDKLTRYVIIRTSWVYGSVESKGFLSKILKSIENGQKTFYGVYDYISCPTSCTNIKNFVILLISKYFEKKLKLPDLFHITDEGYCSKYFFIKKILKIYFKNDIKHIELKRVNQKFFSSTIRSKKTILSTDKIKKIFNYYPHHWTINLEKEINLYNAKK